MSGVPQGTVLGPLLFSLYINYISSDIESEIRLFADYCVCYREIKDEEDTMKQIVGIPMGTNCAPLIADLFYFAMKEISLHLFLTLSKLKFLKHLNIHLDIWTTF